MDIKPIKNDEDHRAALAEIERLMDAQPETRLAALRQAFNEGEESGRADYSLKGLLDELDGDTP